MNSLSVSKMAVYNARWGILATGRVAKKFVHDLLKDTKSRSAEDISHTVTAVASSSSIARAKEFIRETGLPDNLVAYGSYEELVKDPNVDVIYVASPHSHHYQNVRLALEANKHVLCEKAFTVNAAQAKILVDLARSRNLFLMEAVWTRFFPLSICVRDIIKQGEIGEVVRVVADNSIGNTKGWDANHRMVNLDLAGGALLDMGIYSLTWVFQVMYHTLPPSQRRPPCLTQSTMVKYPATGVDEDTTMLITFPTTTPANNLPNKQPGGRVAVRIQGTKGEIQVDGPCYRPMRCRVIPKVNEIGSLRSTREIGFTFPANGHGMYWEADEVVRCLRDRKLESESMPLEETIVIMKVMDEVRKQNDLIYPANIESTEYPLVL
ncbi:hypothetical protein EYB25_005239 [Talaromyces marneffei]|uniref:D-xylose 1-dehydrogenase (NADP(+), D-xylono-1,5-lactone-forming) n=2 Tax=Talaromyces marneffei TaxID=37727 RepID=A0A093X6V2_TALMA|nr:hypothetical protein EYB25_005239 [Talaromyces marneffei]